MHWDIESSTSWKRVDEIKKGWSSDKKYLVRTDKDDLLVLRMAAIEDYDKKKREYETIKLYSGLGINMSEPMEFGICNDGRNVYILVSWVEGRDLGDVLKELDGWDQYLLGREAGRILKKIHSLELDIASYPIKTKRERKLAQLARYEGSSLRIANDEAVISYIKDNIDRIWTKPAVYQHGDYHPGNLIYGHDGTIGVIDFNRWEIGDPYEEFYKLESFAVELSIPYAIGEIDSYFEDKIPEDFWLANGVYVAHASLYSIKWAETYGEKDVKNMVKRAERAFLNYDYFRRIIPVWYSSSYRERFYREKK